MAFYYADANGTTAGFGTLNNSIAVGATIASCSTSNLGTAATTAIAFTSANAHELSYGSAATNNGTPGVVTLSSNGSAPFFRGITFQNLTGNQSFVRGGAVTNFTTNCITMVGTNPYIDVSATGKLILSVTVSGSVNWEKRGSSALQLLQANNFSGGMTIAAGTVEIGNASALGTGTVIMNGGKLSGSAPGVGYSLANALTLNGTMTLGDTTNNGVLTFAGTTTISGATTLTAPGNVGIYGSFQGSGSFSYSGNAIFFEGTSNNTYSGAFTLTSGVVVLAANAGSATPNQLGTGSITVNGGQLEIRGNTTHTFTNTISGVSSAVIYNRNTSATGLVFNGTMSGFAGSFRIYADSSEGANPVQKVTLSAATQFAFATFFFQSGGGITSLSQTLSYTGNSSVDMGAPFFIFVGAGPATTTKLSNNSSNGSTFTQSNVLQLATAIGSTFTIDAATGPIVLRALQETSTGILAVSKTGSNVATIAGPDASNYRGAVQVTQGTLNANSATALGSDVSSVSVTSGATLSLGAAPTYSTRSLAVSGTGTASTVGALVINNTGTSAFQSITLGSSGTYIRATSSGSINAPFTTNNNSVVFGASAGSNFIPFASLSNVFSGTGSVTYGSHSGDTGIVRADVQHTYTGNTTIAFGKVVVAAADVPGTRGPLGAKLLTDANTLLMTGGVLQYGSGNSRDYSGRFSTAGGQQWKIDVNGDNTITYATALLGASSLSLSDEFGGGSLTLSSASSTFSGGVTLTSGTLYAAAAQNGSSGPLGLTGTITFAPAGTGVLAYTSASAAFDYSSRFATTSGQTRRINVNGENITFSTALGGTNAFALVGSAGTLTLAVANTYTQGTTLSVGTLKCSNVQSLGTGASASLAQANNTTLHVTTVDGKMTITGAHTNTGTGSRTIRIGAA